MYRLGFTCWIACGWGAPRPPGACANNVAAMPATAIDKLVRIVFSLLNKLFRTYRKAPNPLPGRREYRIRYSRRNRRRTGLADASRRFMARHKMHFDNWHLVDPQHFILMEVS